jgi:hypothetical protein
MKRLMLGLAVLAGCVVLGMGAVRADEKNSSEAFPLPDIQGDVPRYVSVIEAFGTIDALETALNLVEGELPGPFPKADGPFGEDVRARWKQEFGKLSALNARFDSVDFVGYQSISSGARTLVFIGHGFGGPIQFRFRVFRYQDKWKVANLSFQGDWNQIEADSSFTRFENPVHYPLATQPVVQTDQEAD